MQAALRGQLDEFLAGRRGWEEWAARHRPPAWPRWPSRTRTRPRRALHPAGPRIAAICVRARLVGRRRRAHDGPSNGRVADHEADIQCERLRLDDIEELGERLPLVASTPARRASTGIASTRASSRVRKSRSSGAAGASVSPQLPLTAVVTPCKRRRAQGRIPEELGVIVGVQIDEPRGHDQPFGVDGDLGPARSSRPTSAIRPSTIPTSPARRVRRCRPPRNRHESPHQACFPLRLRVAEIAAPFSGRDAGKSISL